jgi:hypothetical protein
VDSFSIQLIVWSLSRCSVTAAMLLLAMCLLPTGVMAQKISGPLASATRLSEYVIQGTANDQRVELLLQQSAFSTRERSRLIEALSQENAAWNALLNRIQVWKPSSQELQQQIPQRMAQLVSLAHSSLLESVGTIKKSPHYTWLAGRLNSSLVKVNSLQACLKRMLAAQVSVQASSKTSSSANRK